MDIVSLSMLIVFVVVVIMLLVLSGVFIVKQWEKIAVLRFGQIVRMAEPGLNFRIPFVDSLYRVDMRMQSIS